MNKRPTFVLRFRTKKQFSDMKRAAKAEHFASLNEYIVRTLEINMGLWDHTAYQSTLKSLQDGVQQASAGT